LSQLSAQLTEANEVKLKVLAELSQAKEEAGIRQTELGQKDSAFTVIFYQLLTSYQT
jgi:hypothetical protein